MSYCYFHFAPHKFSYFFFFFNPYLEKCITNCKVSSQTLSFLKDLCSNGSLVCSMRLFISCSFFFYYLCTYFLGPVPTTPFYVDAPCPGDDWEEWGSYCYYFNTQSANWDFAQSSCESVCGISNIQA